MLSEGTHANYLPKTKAPRALSNKNPETPQHHTQNVQDPIQKQPDLGKAREKYDQIASKTLCARQEDQHPGIILEDRIG